jgi:hypothetical protein
MDFTWIKGPTSDTKSSHALGWIRGPTRQPPIGKPPGGATLEGQPILRIGRTDLGAPILALHVAAPHWSLAAFQGVLEHFEPPSKSGPFL